MKTNYLGVIEKGAYYLLEPSSKNTPPSIAQYFGQMPFSPFGPGGPKVLKDENLSFLKFSHFYLSVPQALPCHFRLKCWVIR